MLDGGEGEPGLGGGQGRGEQRAGRNGGGGCRVVPQAQGRGGGVVNPTPLIRGMCPLHEHGLNRDTSPARRSKPPNKRTPQKKRKIKIVGLPMCPIEKPVRRKHPSDKRTVGSVLGGVAIKEGM